MNREGVKTWITRRFGVEHFQALSRKQFGELLAQLPKMAEIKAKREQIPTPTPTPLTETEKEKLKDRAQKMMEQARNMKEAARFANGQTHYREMEEAAILENEARHLAAQVA